MNIIGNATDNPIARRCFALVLRRELGDDTSLLEIKSRCDRAGIM